MKKKWQRDDEESVGAGTVDPNLFLDEEKLITLAMRELNGKRPFARGNEKREHAEAMRNVELRKAMVERTLLQRELDSRGWTTIEIARALNISQSEAVALIAGRTRILRPVAERLAQIFATSVDFWL